MDLLEAWTGSVCGDGGTEKRRKEVWKEGKIGKSEIKEKLREKLMREGGHCSVVYSAVQFPWIRECFKFSILPYDDLEIRFHLDEFWRFKRLDLESVFRKFKVCRSSDFCCVCMKNSAEKLRCLSVVPFGCISKCQLNRISVFVAYNGVHDGSQIGIGDVGGDMEVEYDVCDLRFQRHHRVFGTCGQKKKRSSTVLLLCGIWVGTSFFNSTDVDQACSVFLFACSVLRNSPMQALGPRPKAKKLCFGRLLIASSEKFSGFQRRGAG